MPKKWTIYLTKFYTMKIGQNSFKYFGRFWGGNGVSIKTTIWDLLTFTNGTVLSKWFVRMASEIVERETTTNVLHSPFCVTFRESYKIEESKSTFNTYSKVTLPYIKYCWLIPKFTFRLLNSNEWAHASKKFWNIKSKYSI